MNPMVDPLEPFLWFFGLTMVVFLSFFWIGGRGTGGDSE